MYYINYFFLYSLFGHLLESTLYLIIGNNGKSGYLLGPWTPVYGLGIVIILLINNFIKKHIKLKKYQQMIILFLAAAVLLSAIEWLGGISIEYFFHYTCWDYSNYTFNIGKYVSLETALIWGTLSVLFVLFLKKVSDKIVSKIPKYITYSLIIIFIIDNILTVIKRLK